MELRTMFPSLEIARARIRAFELEAERASQRAQVPSRRRVRSLKRRSL